MSEETKAYTADPIDDALALLRMKGFVTSAEAVRKLRAEVGDWRNSAKRAAEESCGDEKHCTCVSQLRATIAAKDAEIKRLKEECRRITAEWMER